MLQHGEKCSSFVHPTIWNCYFAIVHDKEKQQILTFKKPKPTDFIVTGQSTQLCRAEFVLLLKIWINSSADSEMPERLGLFVPSLNYSHKAAVMLPALEKGEIRANFSTSLTMRASDGDGLPPKVGMRDLIGRLYGY